MTRNEKFFFWVPRILSIGFVLFLSLFALDVFSEYSGWSVVVPLLIHLIPSIVLTFAIIIAWKYDLVGVFIFIGFAVFYILMAGFDRPWSWYAFIVGPSTLVGILYLISWLQKNK